MKNIFADGELDKNSVTEKISATAADEKKYPTQFYNLDAIISVGYRVNSCRATSFRIWATSVLKEYRVSLSFVKLIDISDILLYYLIVISFIKLKRRLLDGKQSTSIK